MASYSASAPTNVAYGGAPGQNFGSDDARAAAKSNVDGTTNDEDGLPDDMDEQAGDNDDLMDPLPQDPLDKGATDESTTIAQVLEHDMDQDTGPSPTMRFPLLDVVPNSITSTNTDEWSFRLVPKCAKAQIDYGNLMYETVVGNIQGHKKAYNSKVYGQLVPTFAANLSVRPNKKTRFLLDSESLKDSLAEAPFGFRKANTQLADDLKRNMRTYVMPNSHYHGGPTMLKRGLNQFRNQAIKKKALDPSSDTVMTAVQTARDAFVLNDQVLYANNNVKLQFRTTENAARYAPGSENSGHIAPPTDYYGTQNGAVSNERSLGFGTVTSDHYTSANIPAGVLPPSFRTAAPMAHAPSQPNTGVYATHATTGAAGVPQSLGQAPNTMGR